MKISNQLEKPDQFYDELAHAHQDLDRQASEALNARLVFILANQIGNQKVLSECIALAARVPKSVV